MLVKLENRLANKLKKHWFIEGLIPSLRKKMKVVPFPSYVDAYNWAMDIESKSKTFSWGKRKMDDDERRKGSSDEESKMV